MLLLTITLQLELEAHKTFLGIETLQNLIDPTGVEALKRIHGSSSGLNWKSEMVELEVKMK